MFYIILYYIRLDYIILCYVILYYIILYYVILYIVESFFRNSSFISNTKSQLAPFTFSIAKRVMFRPCPEGMANSGPNMTIVETFFPTPFFSPILKVN